MLAMQPLVPPAHSGRLLGRTTSSLTLLVRGGEHDGRILRIASAKCTIGSAPGCTLRLRTAGVRPVHCWILRGARSMLLRSWTPDVQLNGAAVRDAYLQVGDRLRIGRVEFEILTAPSAADFDAADERPLPPRPAPASLRDSTRADETPALAAKLRATTETLTRREAELDELRRSAQAQMDGHREAFDCLRGERDQLQTQWAEQQARQQSLTDQQTAEWLDERAALEQQLTAAKAALANEQRDAEAARRAALDEAKLVAGSLIQAGNELAQLRQELQGERSKAQDARLAFQRDLEAAQERGPQTMPMQQITAELARAAAEEAEQTSAWEAERTELNNQVAGLETQRVQLQQELVALQAAGETAEAQRAEFAAELAAKNSLAQDLSTQVEELGAQLATATRQQVDQEQLAVREAELEQQAQQLTRQLAELRQEMTALQAACETAEAQRDEFAAELAAKSSLAQELSAQVEQLATTTSQQGDQEQLAAREAELEQQAQQIADQWAELQRREQLAQERLNEAVESQEQREAQLNEWRTELEQRHNALERHAALLQEQHADLVRDREALAEKCRANSLQGDHTSDADQNDGSESSSENSESAEAPNVDSILARLAEQGIIKGDESGSSTIPGYRYAPPQDEEPQAAAEAPPMMPVASPAPVAPMGEQDDDSIEAYMSRLLMRVRGDDAGHTAPFVSPVKAVPAVKVEVEVAADSTPAIAMVEPVKKEDYIPRSQAPEQTLDLAVMREVANTAARTAINTHANMTHGKRIIGRRVLTLGLLLTAAVGLSCWAYAAGSWLVAGGAVAVLLVLAGMGLQTVLRQLRAARLTPPDVKK